jgi:F-type H+-transporting ATPase subunit delta
VGTVAEETIARRYASAIFSLAQERDAVERIGRDLTLVLDAITSDENVQRFFFAPVIDRKEKAKIVTDAFERSVHEIALHSILLLVRKRRERYLRSILDQYRALEIEASGKEPLEIVCARELSRSDVASLVERLSNLYNKRFVVTERVDPGLIGGVRLTLGDRRIDGTIAGRLNELARSLSQN